MQCRPYAKWARHGDVEHIREMLKMLTTVLPAGTIIYVAGVMFAKLSILVLYYRIFGVDKKFRYTCIALMVIVAGYSFSCCMAKIFRCLPVAATWDFNYKGPERCIDNVEITFLRLPRWKKFALSVIFMFGAFACAMSIARQAFLYRGRDTKFNYMTKGSYQENKNYVKQSGKCSGKYSGKYSGKSKPTTRGDEMELKEHQHPIVSDAGYPTKNSDEDLRSQHGINSGIIRTDRFEVHSEDKV
ncbi:MAG: hypothetical protein Q9221_001490 [Calogaya cf. arnoldii]